MRYLKVMQTIWTILSNAPFPVGIDFRFYPFILMILEVSWRGKVNFSFTTDYFGS